ncbi:hypothetical protein BH20ACT5_BH20ACT5_25680 [soil metagenome]
MSFPRRLYAEIRATWRVLLKEFSAYGVVGVVNLGIDIAIFNLLLTLGVGPLTAKVAATVVSLTSAYFMHRHWSFSHRARTGVRREYPLFFLINGIALLMGLLVIALVRYGLDREDVFALNVANLVGIAIGTLFRFWCYKRWVFPAVQAPG